MDSSVKTVMICGVGGQGAILAADILARCCLASELDVKISEIHGMSQRGGAVTTIVRFGGSVSSMVASPGDVDYLLAFETTEAARNIHYLKANGLLIVNDQVIQPLSVLTGSRKPADGLKETLESQGAKFIDARRVALQSGSSKAINIVMLGALSSQLPFAEDTWLHVIKERVPSKFVESNIQAFKASRTLMV